MCVKHEQDGAVFSSKAVEECNLGTKAKLFAKKFIRNK